MREISTSLCSSHSPPAGCRIPRSGWLLQGLLGALRPSLVGFLGAVLACAAGLPPLPAIGAAPSQGVASWYGLAHEGRKTASGAIFKRREFTAAHRTARFGTRYLVSYKDQIVEVLVNDRGPYSKRQGRYSRDLDLSEAAARSLGLASAGIARVSLREISYPAAQTLTADQLLPLSPRIAASFD